MFGIELKRFCKHCNEEVTVVTATGYSYKGKDYSDYLFCPKCKNDITEEDRKVINEALANDKKNLSFWMS